MSEAKFIGSVFGYEENGYEYNVSYSFEESKISNLGISMPDVVKIEVKDRIGMDARRFVNMERVEKICREKAIEAYFRTRPGMNDN